MKKILLSTLIMILVGLFIWFWFSVANHSFNIFTWKPDISSMYAYVSCIFTGAAFVASLAIQNKKL